MADRAVIIPPGDDPIPVLLSMQKFLPGEDRGLCEIMDGDKVIGITALIGHPERTAMPIFDALTREVACVELGAWLKARAFEASASRWDPPVMGPLYAGQRKWRLVTGRAEVPPMPPEFPTGPTLTEHEAQQRSADLQQRIFNARR